MLRTDLEAAGGQATCPACGKTVVVPLSQAPAPVPEAPPEAPTPLTSGSSLVEKAKPGLQRAGQYLGDVFRFYTRNAPALWRRFSTASVDPREIELLPEETYKSATFDETGWTVRLPPCCVVCGQQTESGDQTQAMTVDDLTQPLWVPVGFAIAGLVLSWWFWSVWLLLVLLPAGLLVGYRTRREVPVRVTCRRCEDHSLIRTVPRFRLVGENLYVGVGHKKVVELFAKKNTPEKVRPGPTAHVPDPAFGGGGWDAPAPPKSRPPESIPLDDAPLAPEQSVIKHPETMPLDDSPPKTGDA